MDSTENVIIIGEDEQKESLQMTEEQIEHVVSLVDYLCSTHNALLAAVQHQEGDEQSDVVVLDAQALAEVLTSLKNTAGNFSKALGFDLQEGNAQENVDG